MSLAATAQIHTKNNYLADDTENPKKDLKPELNPPAPEALVAGSFNPGPQMTHATIPMPTDGPLSFAPQNE